MEFDLWQIIIHNDFRIVKVMIAKILVLHELVPMKHRHWNLIIILVSIHTFVSINLK
jgi:hypothetical protein